MMTRTKTKTKTRRRAKRRSPPAATGSVVPAEYRKRYGSAGDCGDDVATKLKQHCAAADGSIDLNKLQTIAAANDCWTASYAGLNAGLARMSVGNKLRALARRGQPIKWRRP
jgi:hypothetical protein